jgi:hypothetical protein
LSATSNRSTRTTGLSTGVHPRAHPEDLCPHWSDQRLLDSLLGGERDQPRRLIDGAIGVEPHHLKALRLQHGARHRSKFAVVVYDQDCAAHGLIVAAVGAERRRVVPACGSRQHPDGGAAPTIRAIAPAGHGRSRIDIRFRHSSCVAGRRLHQRGRRVLAHPTVPRRVDLSCSLIQINDRLTPRSVRVDRVQFPMGGKLCK